MKVIIRTAGPLSLILFLSLLPHAALAGVLAKVHLSEQKLSIFIDGEQRYAWPISSGRKGWPDGPEPMIGR